MISIIALLLGILLPSLNKVKMKARLILCLGNLRQMAVSTTIYASYNDGYILPSARNGDWQLRYPDNKERDLAGPPWYERLKDSNLLDYDKKQTGILHCPSDRRDSDFCSYSANRYLMGFTDPRNDEERSLWPVRKISGLHGNLSDLILLGERGAIENQEWAKIGGEWSMGGASVTIYGGYGGPSYVGFYLGRHSNARLRDLESGGKIIGAKVPFVMADGHAEAFGGNINCDSVMPYSESLEQNEETSGTGFGLDRGIITTWPGNPWAKLSDTKNEGVRND